jgi:CRP-like cAMP-binding protein
VPPARTTGTPATAPRPQAGAAASATPMRSPTMPPTALRAPATASGPQAPPPPPPLSRVRLAALIPGASQSAQIAPASGGTAMRIPIDEGFANVLATPTNPHKGAGRNTMARFVLPKTPFFSVLTPDLFRMAVERVQLISLAAGEILFRQGDPGDTLFEVAVLVPQEVARLSEGDFFGEIALLADRPRTATVKATVDSQVLALDRALLIDLVAASPDVLKVLLRFLRERLIATLAETSPLFSPFTALERVALAARFQFLEIDDGLAMIEQGKKSPGLFVLLSGEALLAGSGRTVGTVGAGDMFGELSLITGQDATASVVARGRCFVLFLPRAEFSEVIMTHPQILEHIGEIAEARRHQIGRVEML